jgi:hypothetical protein
VPVKIGRVLDDESSQITEATYNSKRMVTSRKDPAGRQTNYTYASNGLDLVQVEQVRSGGTDVLQAFSNYNARHLPGTLYDAAGQDTDIVYNSADQLSKERRGRFTGPGAAHANNTMFVAILIFVLALSSACRSVPSELTVTNRATEPIAGVNVSVGVENFELRTIRMGESASHPFAARKDSGFSVTVRFESGRTIRKEIGYVTSGMAADHRITVSDNDLLIETNIRQ